MQPSLAEKVAALDSTCAGLATAVQHLTEAQQRAPPSPPPRPLLCDMPTQVSPVAVCAVGVQSSPAGPPALTSPPVKKHKSSGLALGGAAQRCAAGLQELNVSCHLDVGSADQATADTVRRSRHTQPVQHAKAAQQDPSSEAACEDAAPRGVRRPARSRARVAVVRFCMRLASFRFEAAVIACCSKELTPVLAARKRSALLAC